MSQEKLFAYARMTSFQLTLSSIYNLRIDNFESWFENENPLMLKIMRDTEDKLEKQCQELEREIDTLKNQIASLS